MGENKHAIYVVHILYRTAVHPQDNVETEIKQSCNPIKMKLVVIEGDFFAIFA